MPFAKGDKLVPMERSKLKNIVILILALMNAILLISLACTRFQENSAWKRLTTQMAVMFRKSGITLSADSIPKNTLPSGWVLKRSTSEEKKIAAFILGDSLSSSNEGGGIFHYTSSVGTATFRSGGIFDITGHLGSGDNKNICRRFCKTFGYQKLHLNISDGNGSGKAFQYYEGYRVVNCSVTFLIQDDTLISVSGTHIPQSQPQSKNEAYISSTTALTRFLEVHRENGTVVSKITGISACYRLKNTASAPLSLVPVWRIKTDTGSYDVNCTTGTVLQE